MKKIVTIIVAFFLLGGMALQAAPVSKSRALDVARKVFAARPATKAAGEVKLLWDGEVIATKSAVQPALYVFTRDGGGFVIVAGDDNVQPVLALSDRNEFKVEGMPANVRWWMETMKAYVRSAAEPTAAIRDQWSLFTATKASDKITGSVTPKTSHFTPEWDQGNNDNYYFGKNVFNAECPTDAGGKTLTGCVATALGEVLTYQSGQAGVTMPTAAHGTISYTLPEGATGVTPAFPYVLGTTYDWVGLRSLTTIATIQTAVADPANEALINNLGQLLADLGAMMEAAYSSGGTSAVTAQIPEKLGTYFDFNKAAYMDFAANYSNSQWIEKLKAEIDKRPIVYSGSDPSHGGHAFVFDGYGVYGGDDVFHVNFGWGGANNGYYYNTAMDTNGGGNYVQGCGAVFEFYPKAESSFVYSLQFANYAKYGIPGLSFVDPFDNMGNFRIALAFKNTGSVAYTGKIKAELVDKNGKHREDITIFVGGGGWTDAITDFPVGYTGLNQFYLIGTGLPEPQFGDKIIFYCTTDEDQNVFAPIKTLNDGSVCNDLAIMPAAFIVTKDSYKVNEWFMFELENYDSPYLGTVWTITEPNGNKVVKKQSDREFKLTQNGNYRIEAAVAPALNAGVVEILVANIMVGNIEIE